MSKLLRLSVVAVLSVLISGCGAVTWRAPVQPPQGLLFADVKAPLTVDFHDTDVTGLRTGSASTLYVHDILITGMDFAWEDASIEAAARAAGLTRVHYADYEMFQVLGVFGKFTVTVHGQ